MRLHDFERRVLAAVAIASVLIVLLTVVSWTWAILQADDDDLPVILDALVLVLAPVILIASWPVLHAAFAALTGGGTRPRRPRLWIAVFVAAAGLWGGVLLWPLIVLSVGAFWVAIVLVSLLLARRLVLRALRRSRG